ncbi:unnamed protein product [Ascophyllum nodosum]
MSRRPPPSYNDTVALGTVGISTFATTGGSDVRPPRTHYSSTPVQSRLRPTNSQQQSAGSAEPPTVENTLKALKSNGIRVIYYPPQRGKPEERRAWSDEKDFVLISKGMNLRGKKKLVHHLADLQAVTLGLQNLDFWANGATGSANRRLGDHLPDPQSTLRLRFARDTTVDIACMTMAQTQAMYKVFSEKASATNFGTRVGAGDPFASNSTSASSMTAAMHMAGGPASPFQSLPGGGTGRRAATLDSGRPVMTGSRGSTPARTGRDRGGTGSGSRGGNRGRVPNGGPKRTRSNLRDMMEQETEYLESRQAFLGPETDDGVDPALTALRPHTLAEVSGAVPQTPACYIVRERESARLAEALAPDPAIEPFGGATTVIFDTVANGKSVLAAAAMQDPRVQGAFPGGVIWLRAGKSAAGKLLRMMELTVYQVAEEIERRVQMEKDARVPERFNDVGTASDYLASLLVRTSADGACETLLVLDDVWDASVVEAFETIGLSLLVTTREPLIARLATPSPSGGKRLIGPLGPLSGEEATAAAAKAAATRRIPDKEATQLLGSTGRCPLAVGVVASTLKQALGPLDWSSTYSKVRKTYSWLQRHRQGDVPTPEEEMEDRITASIAAGLSNMPEENQMLYSALCIIPPGLPVTCRLLEQVWETGKRTTILAAEAFEHRRLLDRLGPGNFVLHYEAARFLQRPAGSAGDGGAWVGCKLRGQGRELAFNRLCKHLDSFDTLRDHLTKRDLWGLTELWNTCEAEAKCTSGHCHVSCRIYESRLDLLRQEAEIMTGSGNRSSPATIKGAYEATLDLAQALDMVADFQAYNSCCDPAPLYQESIDSLRQSLDLASAHAGVGAGGIKTRMKRALERITAKLGATLLKQGKPREALQSCVESLSLTRARQGTEGPDRGGGGTGSRNQQPHQDVVDSLYSMAEVLMDSNSFDETRDLYDEAAIILKTLYGEEASRCLVARSLERLASMMATANKLDEAEALNEQSLENAIKAFGNGHPVVARIMDQGGELMLSNKDFEEAEARFSQARMIRESFYGKNHALVAPSLEKQALLRMTAGDEEQAAKILKTCLFMLEDRYGPDDERVARTIEKLRPVDSPESSVEEADLDYEEEELRRALIDAEATAANDAGRRAANLHGQLARLLRDRDPPHLAEAERAYADWQKWLETEIGGRNVGSDKELADCISECIEVLESQGKDLQTPLRELMLVNKRIYGRGSIELANVMEKFGRYLVMTQVYGEAEQVLKRALASKEKVMGANHPELARILRTIGRALFEVNSLSDAGKTFTRALNIDQRSGIQADEVEDMRSLGMVYCRQGAYEDAEKMYRRVVEMDRSLKNGEEDPSVITEINVHAVLLYAQGKLDQAEPLLNKVLKLREKVLGPDHVDAAESLINLAVLNNRKGNHTAALPMLQRALYILENAYGNLHAETVACKAWIAETYQKKGEFEDAEAILVEVVALNRQILDEGHPGVADSLSDLAELCRAQGKLDEAEDHHIEALQIREAHYGPDHETVAQSAQFLSLLLQSAGREDEAQSYARRVVTIRDVVYKAGGGGQRRPSGRSSSGANGSSREHGENARRNHARVAVEKSINHFR